MALILTAVAGLVLKLLLIPGASALMVISLLTLAIFYIWLGFALLNEIAFSKLFYKKKLRWYKYQ